MSNASVEMTALLNETFGREGESSWAKSVYKGTDCGAWFEVVGPNEIRMGSIVEGVDEGATPVSLEMPFTEQQVWGALTGIETECNDIWMQTHGCPVCGTDEDESEYHPVNPECKECEGCGISI